MVALGCAKWMVFRAMPISMSGCNGWTRSASRLFYARIESRLASRSRGKPELALDRLVAGFLAQRVEQGVHLQIEQSRIMQAVGRLEPL
jgi:hypothetical protein